MEGIPTVLLTVLALAGVLLATVAGLVVLLAVVIFATRRRSNAVSPVEPAR
jgi:hypothetical protein